MSADDPCDPSGGGASRGEVRKDSSAAAGAALHTSCVGGGGDGDPQVLGAVDVAAHALLAPLAAGRFGAK